MNEEKRVDEEETYLKDVRDFINEEADLNETEEHQFDFLKDIPHVDPTVEETRTMVQEEITKAMESLSETDQDIFESTGLIHINREISGENLVEHAIEMQKIGNRKSNRAVKAVTVLVLIGIALCITGIVYQKTAKKKPEVSPVVSVEADPDKIAEEEELLEISETAFPDSAFRQYIKDAADTDSDGFLSPEERNNFLIVLCAGHDQIADVHGIESFPQLQGIDLSGTSVTELDVSGNGLLQYINVSRTDIAQLDLRGNTDLTEINVSGCASLEKLVLPEPSAVTLLDVTDTDLDCESGGSGIYTACRVVSE